MRIAVSGASGLIGSGLCERLAAAGHEVLKLVRRNTDEPRHIAWDPEAGTMDPGPLERLDAVVHLAGEPIAAGRWNAARKARIRDSRGRGTRLLCDTLARLQAPPRALICASAIGIYGDRGDTLLDESSPPGEGFLADVCREWEAAADPARDAGIRTVHVRIGIVLSREGGALGKMLTPFRLGLGGIVGSGRQYWSWIALDDLVSAIVFAIETEELSGPVNGTAPNPVTNREFTRILGRVLRRPTIFPLPAFAARLALGEMADELLLGSQKVIPAQLQKAGFRFAYPDLQPALEHLLRRQSRSSHT